MIEELQKNDKKMLDRSLPENKPLTSIRGFASLWVVGHHWFSNSGPGWISTVFGPGNMAVDLFFILSGLILATVYWNLKSEGISSFLLRRVFRIYPLHVFSLLLLVFVVVQGDAMFKVRDLLNIEFAKSVFLMQAFFEVKASANPPAWSIAVELLCYLVFPLGIYALRWRADAKNSRIATICILFFMVWAELWVQSRYFSVIHGEGAVARGLAGFGLGLALYRLTLSFKLSTITASLGELVGCAGIVLSIALHHLQWTPVFSAILLYSLYFDAGPIAKFLGKSWCVWLGHISFSMYLLHFPLLLASEKWFPVSTMSNGTGLQAPIRYALLFGVLLVVSSLTYKYIEVPSRKILRPRNRRDIRPVTVSI